MLHSPDVSQLITQVNKNKTKKTMGASKERKVHFKTQCSAICMAVFVKIVCDEIYKCSLELCLIIQDYLNLKNYDTNDKIFVNYYFLKSGLYVDNKVIVKRSTKPKFRNKSLESVEIINNLEKFLSKLILSDTKCKVSEKCDNSEHTKPDGLFDSITCQECDQLEQEQDLLNNTTFNTEGESIIKSTFADAETFRHERNGLLKESKVVPAENGFEETFHTLHSVFGEPFVVRDETETIKHGLVRLEVIDHKLVSGFSDIVKVGVNLHKSCNKNSSTHNDDDDDDQQLLKHLLQWHHFHIKPPICEVYMAPNVLWHPNAINGIPWNMLRVEQWRLYTYSLYPHTAKKSAILLAEAGFAYCGTGRGNDDRVICFSCCAVKQDWLVSDIIFDTHKHLSPDCSMVTGIGCTNIPMKVPINGEILFNQLYNSIDANINSENKEITNVKGNDIEFDGANGLQPTVSHIENSRNTISAQAPLPLAMTDPKAPGTSNPSFSWETARLPLANSQPTCSDAQSNSNSSPLNTSIPPETPSRSQSGSTEHRNMISTSSADTAPIFTTVPTSAPSTQQVTGQTPPSSAASSSNVNQSNQNSSTEVEANASRTNQSTTQPQGNTQTGTADTQNTQRIKNPTYADLNIITERPKRFEYAVRANRLTTFDPWPRDHHLKKEDLADAGFYFAGYGDCARCFYCGGGLRNWEDDDNVWVEHARWFPKCAHIRQSMGQQFVDAVQDLNRSHDRISLEMVKDKMGDRAASVFHLDTRNMPLKRDPAVLTVMDLGYNEADVLEAANCVKEQFGVLSADKVFEMLEKEKKPRNHKTATPDTHKSKYASNESQNEENMTKLKEENTQLRQQTVCKICMDKEVAVVFLPCGHFVSCTDCAAAMKDCPVCRKEVRGIVRAFVG